MTYYDYTRNYLNFSATGHAQNFRVSLKETNEFKELKEKDNESYQRIKNRHRQKGEDEDTEVCEAKTRAVSKTICFGIVGKHLPRIFYFTYGQAYTPRLTLCLKHEAKKMRVILNSDLISYAK